MSSTNRGAQRIENDVYNTPEWCVRRLLEAVQLPVGKWLEPAVGEGAIIRAVKSRSVLAPLVEWTAVDIRGFTGIVDVGHGFAADFLRWEPRMGDVGNPFKVCITNPPYSLAQQFIEHALDLADTVVMLLRLNYLGSEDRAPFWHSHPTDVYVLPNRPSFVGGKTDSCEYAWFVFGEAQRQRGDGSIRVLATTPRSERCRK